MWNVIVMNEIKEKIKCCVMYISLQERTKREHERNIEEVKKLRDLSDFELDMEYIKVKSRYEYKRAILGLFLITILLSVLTGVWNAFYEFIQLTLKDASTTSVGAFEIAKIGFGIAIILSVFITITLCIVLIQYMKQLYTLYRKMLLIEMIKDIAAQG